MNRLLQILNLQDELIQELAMDYVGPEQEAAEQARSIIAMNIMTMIPGVERLEMLPEICCTAHQFSSRVSQYNIHLLAANTAIEFANSRLLTNRITTLSIIMALCDSLDQIDDSQTTQTARIRRNAEIAIQILGDNLATEIALFNIDLAVNKTIVTAADITTPQFIPTEIDDLGNRINSLTAAMDRAFIEYNEERSKPLSVLDNPHGERTAPELDNPRE